MIFDHVFSANAYNRQFVKKNLLDAIHADKLNASDEKRAKMFDAGIEPAISRV